MLFSVFESARTLEDQATAGRWLGDTFGRWADALPRDELAALGRYKGDEYASLNPALRRRRELSEGQAREVALLDRFALGEPVLVYRGFHLVGRPILGAEIQDLAYVSTSLLRRHAEGFLVLPAEQPFRPALARVLLSAGTRCGAPDLIEYLGEVEILLPCRSRFTIHAATQPSKERPYWAVDLEATR